MYSNSGVECKGKNVPFYLHFLVILDIIEVFTFLMCKIHQMTVTIQQQIEEFKQLSFEVKKEKLLAMLEMIKTSHEYFPQLIEIIKTNAQIDSPRLD